MVVFVESRFGRRAEESGYELCCVVPSESRD
jgi:hypothetical protein